MSRTTWITCFLCLALAIPGALLAFWQKDKEKDKSNADSPAAKEFLKVGQTYLIIPAGNPDNGRRVTVLEKPQGDWVKVKHKHLDKDYVIWMNLRHASAVVVPREDDKDDDDKDEKKDDKKKDDKKKDDKKKE